MTVYTQAKVVHKVTSQTIISVTPAPEVSAWSEDLGGGVVRQTVVTPHPRAMDGSAPAIDLSHGQRPAVGCDIPWPQLHRLSASAAGPVLVTQMLRLHSALRDNSAESIVISMQETGGLPVQPQQARRTTEPVSSAGPKQVSHTVRLGALALNSVLHLLFLFCHKCTGLWLVGCRWHCTECRVMQRGSSTMLCMTLRSSSCQSFSMAARPRRHLR